MNRSQYVDEIEALKMSNHVVVYGLGEAGDNFWRMCQKYNIHVDMYVDTYRRGKFYGQEICGPEELIESYKNNPVDIVICAGPAFEEIRADLIKKFSAISIYDGGDLFSEFLLQGSGSDSFLDYYNKNLLAVNRIIDNCADDFSRDVMESYIRYLQTSDPRDLDGYWSKDQYFPENIYKEIEGTFIDGGSYNGINAKEILEKNPGAKKVLCYEPFVQCISIIKDNIVKWNIGDKVEIHNAALYSVSGVLRLCEQGTASKISDEGIEVRAERIDDLEDRISFIKMDIEGSELEALKGAEMTIRRDKPYLAICIYHKPEDIVEIPNYIMGLNLDYSYYIRHHERNQTELVFYAIPNS